MTTKEAITPEEQAKADEAKAEEVKADEAKATEKAKADEGATTQKKGEKTSEETPEKTPEELKAENEKLKVEAKQAKTLQSQADKKREAAERKLKRRSEVKEDDPTGEDQQAIINSSIAKISSKIIANKDYQKLVNENPTLAKTLANNPSALMDDEFNDADDIVAGVLDHLDDLVIASTDKEPNDKKDEDKNTPAPSSTTTNPPHTPERADVKAFNEAKEKGDITGMINSKLNIKK